MIQISFHIDGFWHHVTYDPKHNIGHDLRGDIWLFRNGRIVHADNPAMNTNKYYSEPIKEVA